MECTSSYFSAVLTTAFCALQGILPNLAKVAPAAGISWFVFEEVKSLLGVDPHS